MFTDFHPDNFNEKLYQQLSNLDQARYDAHCLYEYLYEQHVVPFLDLNIFRNVSLPKKPQLVAKNRQICLAEMESVARSIYTLIDAHLNLLLGINVSEENISFFKQDVRSSLSDLADVLSTSARMFVYLFHKDKFQIARPYLGDLSHYYPSLIMDASCDLQTGFSEFYDFLLRARENTPTPIMISYRNDGKGKGAVYDHATFQSITGRDTVILTDGRLQLLINDMLNQADQPILTYGIEESGYKRPLYFIELDPFMQEEGMIVVPGLAEIPPDKMSQTIKQQNQMRADFETELVNKYSGKRVMLFICGGLYRFFEASGEKVVSIKGHSGSMPHFEKKQLVGNTPAHSITISPNSKIAKMMGFGQQAVPFTLNVTSVHQKAAIKVRPQFLQKYDVVARTADGVIEAVESKGDGSITVGMQSHPECSFGNTNDQKKQRELLIQLANEADKQCKESVKTTRNKMLLNSYMGIEKVTEHSSMDEKFDRLIEEDQKYFNQWQEHGEEEQDEDQDEKENPNSEVLFKNCATPSWSLLTGRTIASDILERDTDNDSCLDFFIPKFD